MTLTALREDALTSTSDGMALRLGLPWIRSLPLASLRSVRVEVDEAPVDHLRVEVGDRAVDLDALADEPAWWFVQDRVVLRADTVPDVGVHTVSVSFELLIPYLQAGPDGPLVLPFHIERSLQLDAPAPRPSVSRDVA